MTNVLGKYFRSCSENCALTGRIVSCCHIKWLVASLKMRKRWDHFRCIRTQYPSQMRKSTSGSIRLAAENAEANNSTGESQLKWPNLRTLRLAFFAETLRQRVAGSPSVRYRMSTCESLRTQKWPETNKVDFDHQSHNLCKPSVIDFSIFPGFHTA